jgi:hypothetical protein
MQQGKSEQPIVYAFRLLNKAKKKLNNALSSLPNITESICVLNQTINASLFYIGLE